MSSPEDKKGAQPPDSNGSSANEQANTQPPKEETVPSSSGTSETDAGYEDPYAYEQGGYGDYQPAAESTAVATTTANSATPSGGTPPPTPPETPKDDGDDEEDGMLRMSFLGHLEELRSRILKALAGVGLAFFACLYFANDLWRFVSEPAVIALKSLGYQPDLAQITPMDAFSTIWVKVPMLASIFIASPWILYQVWAFIAPGLYKKERRWATPFVLTSAGLFILGGAFAYFVAFRYGLTFLLGIGKDIHVKPVINITDYFDLFVNVMLGVGLVFEMPVIIFFLTLLRLASPAFLWRNARYAILVITIIAAIVTPTPDIFNMMLFAVPMCLLFALALMVLFFAGPLQFLPVPFRRSIFHLRSLAALCA